ncbi:hypothetical protein BME96_19010 (plasmid) [Virgibacillus halodenitrificans]|uniref:Uncharacterized protein n=1 Tax=Virgibacillus halodenitrificans TaxID=1482 RepID=A0AAC9J489_VIRHA|nr:hypothetical protein [Virgibacillus halodenitrificans]APC50374.1 hypothetical protein BME96_19010 [Virgibacillus halodenitrificans]
MANKKNRELFSLIDELHEHKEELEYHAIGRRRSDRLNKIEENATKIEKIAIEIQKQVSTMRRKQP